MGAVLVLELLLLDETVQNCVLLLINDCAPVLVALVKGISAFSEDASGRRGHTQGVYTSGVVIMALHATGATAPR